MPKSPISSSPIRSVTEFLDLVFGDEWDSAEICSVPVLGDDKAFGAYWNTGPAGAWLTAGKLDPQWNNYFCVSTLKTPGSRRRNNFKALHVLVLDDVGTKIHPDKPMYLFKQMPSYILETSPGNFQWGYVLDPPITDRDRAESLINRTIKALTDDGVDPGMAGVVRLMRLPFGTNTKRTPPHRVRVMETSRTRFRFDPADLEKCLPPEPAKTQIPPGGDPFGGDPPTEPFDPFDVPATPVQGLSLSPGQPDPTLRAMRVLGLVVGAERARSQGSGWDVICPWHHEHSPSAAQDTGTVYFRGGGIKCWHGHCTNRTPEDVRRRVNEMLADDPTQPAMTIDDLDPNRLTVVDPDKVPPSPLPPEPDIVRRFWDDTVWHAPAKMFIDLPTDMEFDKEAFNDYWTMHLKDHLPVTAKDRKITPAQWYLSSDKRRVAAKRGWAPGQGLLFDARHPGNGNLLRHLNAWHAIKRCLPAVSFADLQAFVEASDWWKLIDRVIGDSTIEQRNNAKWLRWYMAMIVGDTALKPSHNPLLIGLQGAGKGQLWAPLVRVLGETRAINIDQDKFAEKHNTWQHTRLAIIDELERTTEGGSREQKLYANLKRACDPSVPWILVNPKNRLEVNTLNVFVLVITSNEDRPLTLPEDDRRIWVIRAKNTGWPQLRHQELADWLDKSCPWNSETTNAQAIVEYLIRYYEQNRDTIAPHVKGHAPFTQDKEDLIRHSGGEILAWLELRLAAATPDPLALPDIFTVGNIIDLMERAKRTLDQGLRRNTYVPSPDGIGRLLAQAGCHRLHGGRAVGAAKVHLWAKPGTDPTVYDQMPVADLTRAWRQGWNTTPP